jgi:hypothetical protein
LELQPAEIELRRNDLRDARVYRTQMTRDVEVEPEDITTALFNLGTSPREQYETAWHPLDAMIAEILAAGKVRRIEAGKSHMLTDGRLPGESAIAYDKRRYEEERAAGESEPDEDAKARIAALSAKLEMAKKPTVPPPPSTAAPSPSMNSMSEATLEEVLAALDAQSAMSAEALGLLHRLTYVGSDLNATRRMLRAVLERRKPETAEERAAREFEKLGEGGAAH